MRNAVYKFFFSICSCIVTTLKKMLQRCPLESVVGRNSVIFNPAVMQSADLNVVMKTLDTLLTWYVVSQKILRHSNARAQYLKFLEEVKNAVVIEKEFLEEFFFKKVSCCKYDAISHKSFTYCQSWANMLSMGYVHADMLQENIKELSIAAKKLLKIIRFPIICNLIV